MKLPLQISFRNLDRSETIEDRIREEAAQLDEFCDHIMSCRVVVDVPHRHHLTGNVYQIRLDIKVPGEEIAVVHEPAEHDPHYKNVNVAIRDAFDAAARKLEDYVRRQRQDVKHHEIRPHGRIVNLLPERGYGFIGTSEGREVYFHANSVLDSKFDDLTIGTEVTFVEELGEKGPQASTVRILGPLHHLI
jgi:cold shock CspA family protein/ribosome-associated translation inhibitor RaiA